MSESISRRVARLISGSLNALVDSVESSTPATVMEQAIREIDQAINDVRVELGREAAQKHLASKKLIEENNRHQSLSEQVAIAINNGRDDLAQVGIAEQMDIEARIPILENSLADCAHREKELEGLVQALQAKKRDMKAELAAFEASQKTANQVASSAAGTSSVEQRAQKAGQAFERILEKSSGLPSNLSGNSSQLAELEELSRQNRITERLAAMKAGK